MWETRCVRFPRNPGIPFLILGISGIPSFPQPSGRRSELQEEFCLGLLHTLCGLGVADSTSHAFQDGQAHSLSQVLGHSGQALQGFPRRLVVQVQTACAPLFIPHQLGLSTGPMKVEIGVEVMAVELLQAVGGRSIDVAIAQVLADYRAIFGFRQAVIVAVAGTAFGLLDQQLVE